MPGHSLFPRSNIGVGGNFLGTGRGKIRKSHSMGRELFHPRKSSTVFYLCRERIHSIIVSGHSKYLFSLPILDIAGLFIDILSTGNLISTLSLCYLSITLPVLRGCVFIHSLNYIFWVLLVGCSFCSTNLNHCS